MAIFPLAPQLPGEAMLEVFVYPDPARPLDPSNKFSDARRLEFLGEKTAEMAYMDLLGARNRRLSAAELEGKVSDTFGGFAKRVAETYHWTNQVGGYPPNVDRQSVEEALRLFHTYAGAVIVEYGYPELRAWMAKLVAILQ
ncbi:hypothetical protein BV20DRAFT_1055072 [Pilatotrama ljubarskyi]|nr:hypothetical protein BV20DRAFT_1055072 [Pilatotrama ljubarskyi]